jgi:hypothetical protein
MNATINQALVSLALVCTRGLDYMNQIQLYYSFSFFTLRLPKHINILHPSPLALCPSDGVILINLTANG